MEKTTRILIVDDDSIVRDTLESILYPDGYEITFAGSGPGAIKLLDELKPDTILLDVIMEEGMDGLEVCSHIKSKEKWRHIPIIMVTGLDSKEDLARCLNAGADDFVQKPVNGLELRARVKSMLRVKRQFDELQEILHLREDLSNMVMHDMKTPLSAILMSSQLLQLKIKTPQELKFVHMIESQSRRLESLMNDVLMLAKMKEGKMILSRKNVNLNQFIQDIQESYKTIAETKGIKFITEPLDEPCEVSVDKNLFQRVLDNLISNSMKFSPNDSKIILSLERQDPKDDTVLQRPVISIRVIDEGHGIAEEHREDIFEKYKVIAMEKGNIPQFGLGLAFCKMVVEAHAGKIFALPNKPKGTIFTIEI